MRITELFGIDLPIIQAPLAGVQGSALAIAVCRAGGLGSLPCAMLTAEAIRQEMAAIDAATDRPYNLNFFCHTPPTPDATREARWRAALAPYYAEFGIDPAGIAAGPGRLPFSDEIAALIEPFAPRIVSFHFGLPAPQLMDRVHAWARRSSPAPPPWTRPAGSTTMAPTRSSRRASKPVATAATSSMAT